MGEEKQEEEEEEEEFEFSREEFEEYVKQGLKISHGMNLDIIPQGQLPLLVPRAPVAFAYVKEPFSALVPLPMTKFSVNARPYFRVNCLHVTYKISWHVRFVKPGNLCDFVLAVPAPVAYPGFAGDLDCVKVDIFPNCSKSEVKPFSTYTPSFDDICIIERSQVEGGAEVRAYFRFSAHMYSSTNGKISFSIPLSFPFYAKGFKGDNYQQLQVPRVSRKELETPVPFLGPLFKIKIFIPALGLTIRDLSYNFPLQVMMEHKDSVVLLQELHGPNLVLPEGMLTISLTILDGKTPRYDRPLCEDEKVEPSEKRMCLGTTKASALP